MKKVSIIMASYLGYYRNRASNPEMKFIRAVKSFLSQTYENKELIIVADGCEKTKSLYEEYFSNYENIKFFMLPKQELFSGKIRNKGLELAEGDVITYLDNDDILGKKHLDILMSEFTDDIDLLYYDDFLVLSSDFKNLHKRLVEIRYGSIGTSAICHKPLSIFSWKNLYGHDFLFLLYAITNGAKFKKLSKPAEYLVCHYGDMNNPNHGDF
jgi:cellulose synthase/poly-beta-1,6-N-acetylglucosamine synthase-like glycosyltransferase